MRGCGSAIEVLLDIHIEHGLEVAETAVLDDTKHSDDGVEHQMVHLAPLVHRRDENREESIKDISKEIVEDQTEPLYRPAYAPGEVLFVRLMFSLGCTQAEITLNESRRTQQTETHWIVLILPFSSMPPMGNHPTHPISFAIASYVLLKKSRKS